MPTYPKNQVLNNELFPVEIVLSPAWWHQHEGMVFDEDFYFHPARRVEAERKMEKALHARWGRFGMGADHAKDSPEIGPVHLAAGYLLQAMVGCKVEYPGDAPPQVSPLSLDHLDFDAEAPFHSESFRKLQGLMDALKTKYGFVRGDVGWSGVLNLTLDMRGQNFFADLFDQPDQVKGFLKKVAGLIERYAQGLQDQTGTSSIAVNRTVKHITGPVFLHSECSNTMISTQQYEEFFLRFDVEWSKRHRPYGIHYCGKDPHRYAASFAKIPHLDFLDVGWGGDVKLLRKHLPNTFFNLRLSPVDIVNQSPDEIKATIRHLVHESDNPFLTGVCCINMDQNVADEKITAIFETVDELRKEYRGKLADS